MSDNGSSLTRKMNNDFAYQESPEGTVYRPFSISTMNRILNAYEGYQESPDFDFQSYSSSSSGGTPGAGLSSELQGTLKVSGVSESPGSPPISMTRKRSLFNDNFKDDSENKVSSLFGPEDDSENQIPSSLGQTPVKAESNVTKEGGDVGGTRKRSIQRNPRSVLAEITNNCFEPVLNVSGGQPRENLNGSKKPVSKFRRFDTTRATVSIQIEVDNICEDGRGNTSPEGGRDLVVSPLGSDDVNSSFDTSLQSLEESPLEVSTKKSGSIFDTLISGKIPDVAEENKADETDPSHKRRASPNIGVVQRPNLDLYSPIVAMPYKIADVQSFIGDNSRVHILPEVSGRPEVATPASGVADLLNGMYTHKIEKFVIIDCRYPFEYKGGHIKGAVNFYLQDQVKNYLFHGQDNKQTVLIFHCEFSQERGPRMFKFVRNHDRSVFQNSYPKLRYPEMYVLFGGYKQFFHQFRHLCEPQEYCPMLHPAYSLEMVRNRNEEKKSREAQAAARNKLARFRTTRL